MQILSLFYFTNPSYLIYKNLYHFYRNLFSNLNFSLSKLKYLAIIKFKKEVNLIYI